jgi:hypothetical protein
MHFRIKKINVLILILFLLNISDLYYLIFNTFKINIFMGYILMQIILIGFLIKYNKYTINRNLYNFLIIFNLYLIIKLVQGLLNSDESVYTPFIVILEFNLIVYIYHMFSKLQQKELLYILKIIYIYSILLYSILDFINLIIFNKGSLVVILQNNLIIWIISLFTLLLLEKRKYINILIFVYLLTWLFISFNLDLMARVQVKIIILLLITSLFVLLLVIFKKIIFKFTSIISMRYFLPTIILIFIAISLLVINEMNVTDNIHELGRSVSLQKRILIADAMNNNIHSNIISNLFGYGLGTSMHHFSFVFSNTQLLYPSHSGIMSLYYEHGAFVIFIFIFIFILFFIKNKIKFIYDYKHNSIIQNKRIISLGLLIILFINWIVLNLIYLYALPIGDFFHHMQIVVLILLIVILKKQFFNEELILIKKEKNEK